MSESAIHSIEHAPETADSSAASPGFVLRSIGGFLRWLPLVLALALLAQIGILGVKPALEERAFLESERGRVEARNAALHARFESLSDQVEAWQDPVYLERVRRLRAANEEN